jgi:hypothetical protein
MKKSGLIIAVLAISTISVFAQKGDYVIDEKSNFTDRIYVGGGMGLSGGSWGTSISVSPIVGYMVSNRLSVGVGATYQFYRYKDNFFDYTDNRYGGSVFARMNLVRQVFAYGEYSFLNYSVNGDENNRATAYRLPLGLGFTQNIGPRSSFNVIAAYDMLYELNGPYGSPWVISFYFAL